MFSRLNENEKLKVLSSPSSFLLLSLNQSWLWGLPNTLNQKKRCTKKQLTINTLGIMTQENIWKQTTHTNIVAPSPLYRPKKSFFSAYGTEYTLVIDRISMGKNKHNPFRSQTDKETLIRSREELKHVARRVLTRSRGYVAEAAVNQIPFPKSSNSSILFKFGSVWFKLFYIYINTKKKNFTQFRISNSFLRKKFVSYTKFTLIWWKPSNVWKCVKQLHHVYVNTCHIYKVNDYMVTTSQSGLIDFKLS